MHGCGRASRRDRPLVARHGRAALCGAISQYNSESPALGPRNLGLLIGKRLTLRGFLVGDHLESRPAFLAEVGGWLAEGRIRLAETVFDGVENAPPRSSA
jgi:NADPH-dependent curcumin reductase CurA